MATQKETQVNPQIPADENAAPETEAQKQVRRTRMRVVRLSLILLLLFGVVAYIIANNATIGGFLHKINDILMPVIIGLVLAYLSNPVLRFLNTLYSECL